MNKTVLVTGGAGFIGSYLCEILLKAGHNILCMDNLLTGSRANIAHLVGNPRFNFIHHDISHPFFLDEVNEIYNFACPASPVHYQLDPIQTIKTSVLGALNMLELTLRTKAKILQASTSEVYGDPEVHPQPETYSGYVNPIGVRACYDEGKRSAETLFFDFHRKYGTRIKVIRIFNTYGPRMQPTDGRVISNFIMQALTGKNITLYGDGKQTRSFCYITDLVQGIISIMNTPDDFLGPVNLGNPEEFNILKLAEKILLLTNSKSRFVFKPLPQDDPLQRCPDISLAKKVIHWSPSVKLDEGLVKTISYFKKIIEPNC